MKKAMAFLATAAFAFTVMAPVYSFDVKDSLGLKNTSTLVAKKAEKIKKPKRPKSEK